MACCQGLLSVAGVGEVGGPSLGALCRGAPWEGTSEFTWTGTRGQI